ncbi:hypothetical protein MSG28_004726 [Choristoneura fumiferana]|uniref:Uncharacterized protein n=1 Tax=Choristoneura fumiferana TaxID=7141 RepID=A0ACC0K7C2_CHOFU|nr:hypothetical protein MSG28_004726 [Choristoneura fumiferana]
MADPPRLGSVGRCRYGTAVPHPLTELKYRFPPTVWNVPANCDVTDACRIPTEPPTTESLLDTFTAEERAVLQAIPAAKQTDDLLLLAQLHKKGYLRGEQHLEEIMFMENVTRSQLMQLLDKFKDVLITFETEDPAVAMLYPYQ